MQLPVRMFHWLSSEFTKEILWDLIKEIKKNTIFLTYFYAASLEECEGSILR